ncbi:MAG: hypothetical protein HZA78_02345 [Candidatus Schekmanbacteria bacterium]|nr:hypothetical protein [Candidatus Schekmanbacteria bacterium]
MTAAPDGRYLADRYDDLRRGVLNRGICASGCGLTLFLRQGMANWMRAWSSLAPLPKPPATAMAAPQGRLFDSKPELVRILSTMVMKGF